MLIHWQGPRATRSFGLPRSELPTGEQCRRTVHHPARFLSDTVIKCRMLYSIHLISTIYSESASLDGLRAKAAGSFPVVGDCSVLHAASMNGVKRHAKTPFRAHSHRTSDLCFRMSDQILAWTGSASTSGRRQSYKCPCHSCCPTGRPAQYECMLSACFEWTALSLLLLLLLLLLLQFCGPFFPRVRQAAKTDTASTYGRRRLAEAALQMRLNRHPLPETHRSGWNSASCPTYPTWFYYIPFCHCPNFWSCFKDLLEAPTAKSFSSRRQLYADSKFQALHATPTLFFLLRASPKPTPRARRTRVYARPNTRRPSHARSALASRVRPSRVRCRGPEARGVRRFAACPGRAADGPRGR